MFRSAPVHKAAQGRKRTLRNLHHSPANSEQSLFAGLFVSQKPSLTVAFSASFLLQTNTYNMDIFNEINENITFIVLNCLCMYKFL